MLRLLIADDEKVIRESLAECLNWEKHGIRVVACCANGLEALDAIIDESPDIVMTDIKMPGLSGLELIEKMQDIDRDVEFIILSGYREFDFAQKAIDLGVRRYLLKPVSEEQVLTAVLDAAKSCAQRRQMQMAEQEHQRLRQQMGRYYRQQLQYALFLQGSDALSQTVQAQQEYFPAAQSHYIAASLTPLSLDEAKGIIRTLAPRLSQWELVSVSGFIFAQDALMSIFRGETAQMDSQLEKWSREIPFVRCQRVHEGGTLEQCARWLRRELERCSKITVIDDDGCAYEMHRSGLSSESMERLIKLLLSLAEEGNRDEAQARIRFYLGAVEEIHTLHSTGAHLISSIVAQRPFLNKEEYEGVFDDLHKIAERNALIDKIAQTALSLLWENGQDNDLIVKVKRYVKQNLADSTLSLKQIATQHVHVNVDYLSRLFVQETNEKFSHYLNRKRVEKAKLLLADDSSKIYQVAEQVGLGHNPRYFGQVFKKHMGMPPSAYVEQHGE